MKLWSGRFGGKTNPKMEIFSTSINQDSHLWSADLRASIAHAQMLGHQNIISVSEAEILVQGLQKIHSDMRAGDLQIDTSCEDIHSFIELELTRRIGDIAKKLHTARSRNDQVATSFRLFLSESVTEIQLAIRQVQADLYRHSEKETETIMPGMTHLQHAQPVSLSHHLLAYFWMLQRDFERLMESQKRILSLPLGSAALAGTGFLIDRVQVKAALKFHTVSENSLDAVSDRDFVIDFLSHCSLISMHLSRFAEEIILWSSHEFGFVELSDEVTTGSSIMPQKKNPDVAELIRGKCGRIYGSLMGSLTMMKGLPLAYNRDMQEDKYFVMEAFPVVLQCLQMTSLMLQNPMWKRERMAAALCRDFSNATDLADDLVSKGMAFRDAHEVIGRLVRHCLELKIGLEELTLQQLQSFHSKFDQTSLDRIPFLTVLKNRTSEGGASPAAVKLQLQKAQTILHVD